MHRPLTQLVEQQSVAREHESPSVLQVLAPGSATQAPAGQSPVQHSAETPAVAVQVAPVLLHSTSEQRPPAQVPEQQSLGLAHAAPGTLQKEVVVQRESA